MSEDKPPEQMTLPEEELQPMSDESDTDLTLQRISERLDELYYLVLGGGKESRVVETVPSWRLSDCDEVCEFTGTPVPKKFRVHLNGMKVHPGVKAWAEDSGIEDVQDADSDEVPCDYLRIPPMTRLRQRYIPTQRIAWEPEQLEMLDRAAISMLVVDGGVAAMCKWIHPLIDWRYESVPWLRAALITVREHKMEEKELPTLKVESRFNRDVLAEGPKLSTAGGATKPPVTKKKKTAKKKSGKKKSAKKASKK